MAKQSYKIPDTLDKSVLDTEIAIKNDDGIGLKPLSLKVILSFLVSGFICLYMVSKSFISAGSLFAKICFVAIWICLTVLLLREDKTGQMQFKLVPTFLTYMFKSNRVVITRSNSYANGFYSIAGISDINLDTGLIEYADGTYGYMYRVVGSGSVLLFDEDREAILNRVDSFYRKMKTDYEIIYLTAKESQKIYRQVATLKRRYDKLDDDELKALADMEYDYLKNYVGGSFRSTHQYMIIKADNKEALMVGKNMLQSEVENSTLMIKQCTALFGEDLYNVLRLVYKGKESV